MTEAPYGVSLVASKISRSAFATQTGCNGLGLASHRHYGRWSI